MDITPALATIIAATVGGVVALLASRLNLQGELRKWPRVREDAIASSLRQAIENYATTLASAAHSMCWLTWGATQGQAYLGATRVASYNDEIHAVLPRIAGSLASIAALDGRAYEDLAPVAEELYELDAKVGEAAFRFVQEPEVSVVELAQLHNRVASFERSVPRRIAGIVSRTLETRAQQVSLRQ